MGRFYPSFAKILFTPKTPRAMIWLVAQIKFITINSKKSPLILQMGRLQGLLRDQYSFKSKHPCSWSSGALLLFLVFYTPCMLTKPSLCVFLTIVLL